MYVYATPLLYLMSELFYISAITQQNIHPVQDNVQRTRYFLSITYLNTTLIAQLFVFNVTKHLSDMMLTVKSVMTKNHPYLLTLHILRKQTRHILYAICNRRIQVPFQFCEMLFYLVNYTKQNQLIRAPYRMLLTTCIFFLRYTFNTCIVVHNDIAHRIVLSSVYMSRTVQYLSTKYNLLSSCSKQIQRKHYSTLPAAYRRCTYTLYSVLIKLSWGRILSERNKICTQRYCVTSDTFTVMYSSFTVGY